MTLQRIDLFAEMTSAADKLTELGGENRVPDPGVLQFEWRQIIWSRALELVDSPEWLELFGVWYEQYCSGIEARRQSALTYLTAYIEDQAKRNPPTPFVCVCGAVTTDPLAPAFELEHRRLEEIGRIEQDPLDGTDLCSDQFGKPSWLSV